MELRSSRLVANTVTLWAISLAPGNLLKQAFEHNIFRSFCVIHYRCGLRTTIFKASQTILTRVWLRWESLSEVFVSKMVLMCWIKVHIRSQIFFLTRPRQDLWLALWVPVKRLVLHVFRNCFGECAGKICCWFLFVCFVSLTQSRVIVGRGLCWKSYHSSNWSVSVSLGAFSWLVIIVGISAHCGWCHPCRWS